MLKVAILGCENSHANSFIEYSKSDAMSDKIEIVGVYSHDKEAALKLNDMFGVSVMESFDELVGKVDGIIITARHGDNHYKYAKPYINSGIPMFIDKPITVSREDAISFMNDLKENNIKFCGGSSLAMTEAVCKMKESINGKKIMGGNVVTPLLTLEEHGGFFFYAQHLVQIMGSLFGDFPKSVKTFSADGNLTVVVRYDNFDVTGLYVEGYDKYFVSAVCDDNIYSGDITLDGCFDSEFRHFYNILSGGEPTQTIDEFFAPVFIMNAIKDSLDSGKEEKIVYGVM